MAAALNSLAAGISLDDRKRGISMWPRWLVPRFSIRTLLLAVAAIGVGLWSYLYLPDILRNRQDRLSRAAIDPYELSIAGDGDPAKAPPELVAILGDSRLRHWHRVSEVEFDASGAIISVGFDRVACVWDSSTGKRKRSIPATTMGVAPGRVRAFFVEPAGTILVWDLIRDRAVKRLRIGDDRDVNQIVASKDGSTIAIHHAKRSDHETSVVDVWNVDEAKILKSIPGGNMNFECLAISHRGDRVAHRDKSGTVTITPLPDGDSIVLRPVASGDAFRQAEFYDDVHLVATMNSGGITIWNATTGELSGKIDHWGGSPDGLSTNAAGNEIAICNSNRLFVYAGAKDEWRERIELIFRSGQDHVSDIALSGRMMAAAHGDHTISLWNLSRPGLKARITGGEGIECTCAAFHPYGEKFFTASRRGEVTVWEVGTWKKLRSWEAHTTQITCLTISPDGAVLATSGEDRTIVLWDAATGQELRVHPGLVWPVPVSFSHDGAWYAIPGDQFGANQILINEVRTGNPVATIQTPPSTSPRGLMPFSPDGATLLVSFDKQISHYDIGKKSIIATFGIKQVNWQALEAVWFQDGRRAATCGRNGEVVIWDLSTHKRLMTLTGNSTIVKSVALSADERWLATCGWDGKVCVWNTITGSVAKSWQLGPARGLVSQVAFSPDGRYLATVNGNGTAYILRVDGIGAKSASANATSEGN